MKIYNQLDYAGVKFGSKKKSDMAKYACKLFSIATILQKDPVEVDKILVTGGCYFGASGDMLDDASIAKTLGWEFLGRETNINKMPTLTPTIKEVDWSAAAGKQQHFVVRIIKEDGSRAILDPYGGVERPVNYYERKVGEPNWEKGKFSYRVFRIPEQTQQAEQSESVDYTGNLYKIFNAVCSAFGFNYGEQPNNAETAIIEQKLKNLK